MRRAPKDFPGQAFLELLRPPKLTTTRLVSIGVQKGPPIGVEKGPRLSSGVTGMAGVPFALVAA